MRRTLPAASSAVLPLPMASSSSAEPLAEYAARRRALQATLLREGGDMPAPRSAPPSEELETPRVAALFDSKAAPVRWRRIQLRLPKGSSKLTLLWAEPVSSAQPGNTSRPAVLILHSTGKCKEFIAEHLERYARRGYIAVAFDAQHHGERALPVAGIQSLRSLDLSVLGPELLPLILEAEPPRLQVYYKALVQAWHDGTQRPFLYDTVADAIYVMDYLVSRTDVIDPSRIGVTGISLGGMLSWLHAAADSRVAAAAPAIGVHSFRHAIENDLWEARIDTIRSAFEAAAKDMQKEKVDREVVEAVWARIVPGLAKASGEDGFDSLLSLGCVAPRHMLVLSGELDPRCPIDGVYASMEKAWQVYRAVGKAGNLQLFVDKGVGHEMTPAMWDRIDAFMEATLSSAPRARL